MTQKTPIASPSSDVFRVNCPARAILDLLAEKWVLLVVHALRDGPERPSNLRRRIEGISEKMLVQTLRRLETLGIINRCDYAKVPPRVEYSLTPLGLSLGEQVKNFDSWVENNTDAIAAARTRRAGD